MMGREQDSFLQMIGLEESPQDEAAVAMEDFAEPEVSQTQQEEEEFDEDITDEMTEAYESTEIFTSTTSYVEQEFESPENSQIYSQSQAEVLTEDLYGERTPEDELLEGVEFADASRATDIFAQSFRADSRQTRAAGVENPDEFLDEFESSAERENPLDELYEELVEEDYRTQDSVKYSEPVENSDRTLDLGRQTQAFQYDLDSTQLKMAQWVLKRIEGPVSEEQISLQSFPLRLGRDPANEIYLDDPNASRFHAEIVQSQGVLRIVDQGSTNGVKVNGALVRDHKLQSGDVIQIGDCLFEFVDPNGKAASSATGNETIVQTQAAKTPRGGRSIFRKFKAKPVMKVTALVLMLAAGALYFAGGVPSQEEWVRQAVQTLNVRERIQEEVGIPIAQADAQVVKEAFIDLAKSKAGFIADEQALSALSQIPAELYQWILADDELYAAFERSPLNFAEKRVMIENKFKLARAEGRDEEALRWAEILARISADATPWQEQVELLRGETRYVETPERLEPSERDQEEFARVMSDHRQKVEDYISEDQLASALAYSEKILSRLVDLTRKQPEFESFATGAITEWKNKVKFLEDRIAEEKQDDHEERLAHREGLKAIESIIGAYHAGDFTEALKQIEIFKREHAEHKRLAQVESIQEQIRKDLDNQFRLLEENIQRQMEIQNYALAWKSLYQFMDLVPFYSAAERLREELVEETRFKAQQFYNQARVYEVEAGDLLSAEQAYRKALELSDPRSDLTAKIERGYEKVRRKNLQ